MSETGNNKIKTKEKKVCRVLFYSFLFSPLFFYLLFFDRPELSFIGIILPLYGFWVIMMSLDMRITLSINNLILQYEVNPIFRTLYSKYSPRIAVMIQLLIESTFVLVLPSLMFPRDYEVKLFFDYRSSAIFAGIVGIFHLIAWWNNKKNIKETLENKKLR